MARSCTRLRALLLGTVLSLSSPFVAHFGGVAHADEVTITPEARARIAAGVNLLKDPDGPRYEEAYREFRAAYAASPSYKILGNLGLCAMKLERDEEAIQAYEKYIAWGKELDPSELAQVKTDLDTLKAGVAYLTVTSDPPGAKIVDVRLPVRGERVMNTLRPVAHRHAPRPPPGLAPDHGEALRVPGRDVGGRRHGQRESRRTPSRSRSRRRPRSPPFRRRRPPRRPPGGPEGGRAPGTDRRVHRSRGDGRVRRGRRRHRGARARQAQRLPVREHRRGPDDGDGDEEHGRSAERHQRRVRRRRGRRGRGDWRSLFHAPDDDGGRQSGVDDEKVCISAPRSAPTAGGSSSADGSEVAVPRWRVRDARDGRTGHRLEVSDRPSPRRGGDGSGLRGRERSDRPPGGDQGAPRGDRDARRRARALRARGAGGREDRLRSHRRSVRPRRAPRRRALHGHGVPGRGEPLSRVQAREADDAGRSRRFCSSSSRGSAPRTRPGSSIAT